MMGKSKPPHPSLLIRSPTPSHHHSFHDWRVDKQGQKTANGAATDAEEDIALCCIFAQHLVDKSALCVCRGGGL